MRSRIEWGLDDETWAAFVARCPDATFFHTPGWYHAWRECAGYRPDCALITLSDGCEALLPLAAVPQYRGLVRAAHAGLGAAWGGLVAPRPLDRTQADEAFRLVRRRYADLAVTGNPHAAGAHMPATGLGERDDTLCLRLAPRDELLRGMSDSRRKSLRRAEKVGYALEVIERPNEDDLPRFYQLYEASSGGWSYDRWRQDEVYFRALLRQGGRDLVLFLARHEDRTAGFRLIGRHGGRAMALHLARDAAYEQQYVSPWLVMATLDWLHVQGDRCCDFMPSGRLEGVRAYKASFGAEPLAYHTSRQTGALGGMLGKLRGLVVRGDAA